MGVVIEDAGRPCPKCARPLKFFTVTREYLELPPATIIGCFDCGIGSPSLESKRSVKLSVVPD